MADLEIRRAVVTGATGTIGLALCSELLSQGSEVFAIVRPESTRLSSLPQGVRALPCDLNELAKLPQMVEQADAFFHLGWAYTIGDGRNDVNAQTRNIMYALDAVDAAALIGCQVFIGAGSQAEYGKVNGILKADTPCFPQNGYGIAKHCAGNMTRIYAAQRGLRHVWARILSVYGPGDTELSVISYVIRSLLAGEKPSLTCGDQLWDYLYAEDAAKALYLMAKRGVDGRVYPLGSGKGRPLKEYWKILRDVVDPALPLGLGDILYGSDTIMHLIADIAQLQADTGFVPQMSFEKGIRHTIMWMKQTT